MSGHIDWKYLDQASWIYDWMAASQSPKSVTSATMESPSYNLWKFYMISTFCTKVARTYTTTPSEPFVHGQK